VLAQFPEAKAAGFERPDDDSNSARPRRVSAAFLELAYGAHSMIDTPHGPMKIIAFEEHYKLLSIHEANKKINDPVLLAYEAMKNGGRLSEDPKTGFPAGIYDLGEGRIALMDEAGIDVQILSHTVPGPENLEPALAKELSKQSNEAIAAAIAKYPGRFLGFASLPMRDPAAAARELERTVRDLGFVGALINGHVNGRYLDDKFFWPVFECAEALGVPIFLHPQMPPKPVVDTYYSGFAPPVSALLSIAGLGWHIDTGIHSIRLILGGVFDKFPALQIIVGHHFEALSWMAWRTDYGFPPGKNGGLKRSVKEYLRENFYGGILCGEFADQEPGGLDKSWNLSNEAYQGMANTVGIDRILFTTDHPYGNIKAARPMFERMPINANDKEKIAHLNAERLLGLGTKKAPRGVVSETGSANDNAAGSAPARRLQR
jgi:predicted TIM-barrel fold metal-dependent hydrolase